MYRSNTDEFIKFFNSYLAAIRDLNFDLLRYLGPVVEPNLHPYEAIIAAFQTHNVQMINYINNRYPGVINSLEATTLMIWLINKDDREAIKLLMQISKPYLNLEELKEYVIKNNKSHLTRYFQ